MAYTKEEFYQKCKEVHKNEYTYTNDFTKVHNKITVICQIHGDFKQQGYVHLQGSKCPYCQGKKVNKKEIVKSIEQKDFEILTDFSKTTDYILVKCKNNHITKRRVWDVYKRKTNPECFVCSYETRSKTKIERGINIPDHQLNDFELYRRLVNRETSKSIRENKIEDINNRSKEFHLDHIFSIKMGFMKSILPQIIGSLINLRIIESYYNRTKNWKSDFTKEELFTLYEGSTTIP